jgi:uncharacterized membrane protein YdjX (TVP38/TMEM64 family)
VTTARRVAAAGLLVGIVALLVLSERLHRTLVALLAPAQDLAAAHPILAAGVVIVFAALGAMIAFVSSWAVLPFAVFTWGALGTLLLLWAGWIVGGAASYAIGRYIGRPAIGWFASTAVMERYERRISDKSTFGMIVLLQLGLPSEIPGYLLGVVRYPFAWFLTALSLTTLVHGVPAVLLGAGLVERRPWQVAAISGVMIVLVLAAAYALRRRLGQVSRATPSAPPQETGTAMATATISGAVSGTVPSHEPIAGTVSTSTCRAKLPTTARWSARLRRSEPSPERRAG